MKPIFLLFLVLPALAHARLGVKVSGDLSDLKIDLSGEEINVISDEEIASMKFSDTALKTGIEKYFGKWPTDAFLKSPTPWGDLYQDPGTNQVQRHLVAKSAKVLKATSTPSILKTVDFENTYDVDTSFNAGISENVQKTYSSTTSHSNEVSVNFNIGVEFDIFTASAEASFKTSYTHTWGKEETKSDSVTVGSSSGLEVVLAPGQKAVAVLQASRGTVQVEVEYELTYSGTCVANYEDPYKGHHFWNLDINAVLSNAGLPTKRTYVTTFEIGYFSNAKISIEDKTDKKVLLHKTALIL